MKSLLEVSSVVIILSLSIGLMSCADSNDEPFNQINKNAIVETLVRYGSDGVTISEVYKFVYDESNQVTSWTEADGWNLEQPRKYAIKKGVGTIARVRIEENGDTINGYGDYGYENGYIISTPWGNEWTYENGKLVKGDFTKIEWDGDNISSMSGYAYKYSDLENNASININAFLDNQMRIMADDEDGMDFVKIGLASGTRTKNLISEVHYDMYEEKGGGYLGQARDMYTYETDSENRVIRIVIYDEWSDCERVYGVTYK